MWERYVFVKINQYTLTQHEKLYCWPCSFTCFKFTQSCFCAQCVFFFLRLASIQYIFALLDRRSQAIHSHRNVLFTFVPSYMMNFDHPRTNFLLGSDHYPG